MKSAPALLLLFAVSLSACSPIYVIKAASGHARLLSRRQSIDELLASPKTPERTKDKLKLVKEIKSFAFETVTLRESRDYSTVSKIDGPHVSYLVAACRKTSFEPYRWTFPFAGSFPYLGYFKYADAAGHAKRLERKGWDVHVAGASAYNTPLWFSDPIPEPMLQESPGELAALLIHELAHGTVFFRSQMAFNETVASFIGEKGAEEFIERRFGAQSLEMAELHSFRERDRLWINVMAELRQELNSLYQSSVSEAVKLRDREAIFERGRARLNEITPLGKEFVLNNAVIMTHGLYHRDFGPFQAVHDSCLRKWPCTIKKFRKLNKRNPEGGLKGAALRSENKRP